MRSPRGVRTAAAAGCAGVLVLSAAAGAVPATAAVRSAPASGLPHAAPTPSGVTVTVIRNIHFDTVDDVTGPGTGTHCDVVGDLYIPSTATRAHPAPAILTTNGFGGSKADQAYIGEQFGRRGYVVLSYTGLGFGPDALGAPNPSAPPGSGCKIELDSPQWDGQAGDQLLQFLGGRPHIAYTTYNTTTGAYSGPVAAPPVISDTRRTGLPYDPRVGMIGGSYGGEIQFAVADDDPRLDAIVPVITWNDLSYSLAPNDTSQQRNGANPAAVTYATPGVNKFDWTSLFFGEGIADGIEGTAVDPARNVGCPNFDNQACLAKAQLDAQGYPDPTTLAFARQASVESYIDHIRIPTLLMQGQADTLFNLQEAVATYQALRARHVPVQMVWQSWGHSDGTPAPGELDTSPTGDPLDSYEGTLIAAWFDRYLKHDRGASTGAGFQYYQDWQPSPAHGPDTDQYAGAPAYPVVTTPASFQLSGTDALIPAGAKAVAGTASFATSPLPTSYSETSAVQGGEIPNQDSPPTDAPGTFAAFTSTPLTRTVDQVGSPELTLHLSAPTYAASEAAGASGELALFAKLYDISPSGTVTLVHRLIAPFRVADVGAPVHVELPAVVHRYLRGDRLELVVAAGDAAYRDNDVAAPVSVLTGPADPDTLTVPLLTTSGAAVPASAVLATPAGTGAGTGAGAAPPAATAAGSGVAPAGTAAGSGGSGGALALTGLSATVPLAALAVLVLGLVLRRQARRGSRSPS